MEVNKFRNASNARYLKALFFEQTLEDKSTVLYSLKEEDHAFNGVVYPSLRRLYLEEEDLTEYDFSNKYLDGWSHWEMLCECTWFKPIVDQWRKELRLKLEAKALKVIKEEAQKTGKNAFQANKILLDKISEKAPKRRAGAPSKEEKLGELKRQTQYEKKLQDDLKRIKDVSNRADNPVSV